MLLAEQLSGLQARFRHFDADRTAKLFHPDQPPGGLRTVKGQGEFPAVRMRNGTWWYYDRENRPSRLRKDGTVEGPMKSQAPQGSWELLWDTLDTAEGLLVEGEGHLVALVSIGFTGVVCAGGVNRLLANSPAARQKRADAFKGRAHRTMFDHDEAGQAAARKVARKLYDAGATKVAIVPVQPWPTGWDLEDWLASFDDPQLALGELVELLGRTEWASAEELDSQEESSRLVQSERIYISGSQPPMLAVMVYEEASRKAQLAVFGPPDIGSDGALTQQESKALQRYGDQSFDATASAWRVLDSWRCNGVLYRPDVGGDTLTYLQNRQLVLCPPPTEPGPSERLFTDIREFQERWVEMDPQDYNVTTAYVLLTYRLEDAQFPYCPYLRFYGPPGTGKGRALAVLRHLCWRSLGSQPTDSNLHRLVEYFGDVSLAFDEFHLDRGMSRESQERMIDTLNLGNDRTQGKIRVEKDARGRMTVRIFRLFGPKMFAGYGHDEHESLARRTVNIHMRKRDVPDSMNLFALPEEFYRDAEQLRGRLLGWRAEKLALGMPDPSGPRAKALLKAAGADTGQVFWPLVEMVPAGMGPELRDVLDRAALRREHAREAREVSEDAYLLAAVAELVEEGRGHAVDGGLFVTAEDIAEHLGPAKAPPSNVVARKLHAMGLPHGRRTVAVAGVRAKRGGVLLDVTCDDLAATFIRHGVTWPPAGLDGEKEAAL